MGGGLRLETDEACLRCAGVGVRLRRLSLTGRFHGRRRGDAPERAGRGRHAQPCPGRRPPPPPRGASLTDLSGYRIYYGISEDDLSQTIQLAGVGLQTYMIDNLGQGTWYFAIRAVTSAGVESSLSNIVSKTIN